MAEPRYFIRQQGGGQQGPFSWTTVERYAAEGRVRPEMEFSADGVNWWRGEDWAALFPEDVSPPATAPVPTSSLRRSATVRRPAIGRRRSSPDLRRSGRIAMAMTILMLTVVGGAVLFRLHDEPAATPREFPVPSWAYVAPSQVTAAKKHGVPVAFENELGMRFVLIPAGTFRMGSPESERRQVANEGGGEVDLSDEGLAADPDDREPKRVGSDWMDDETLHQVTLSEPFYMAIHEVTNVLFRRWDPSHASGVFRGLGLSSPQQPVARVSWHKADGFSQWLSQRSRHTYRLPTEAEWECACRAGTSSRYPWGDDLGTGHRHANGNDSKTATVLPFTWPRWRGDDGFRVSAPVGTYPPNQYGLHDMTGNVWEWCADWYGPLAQSAIPSSLAPAEGRTKVCRGGSWYEMPGLLRAAARNYCDPDEELFDHGFRLVALLPTRSD